MRNQADSPHTEDMNYELTTADLGLFLKKHGLSKANFVGHTLAGRIVMNFAVNKIKKYGTGSPAEETCIELASLKSRLSAPQTQVTLSS
ncbi:hypothetical protein MRX96_010797 [Rhipicephalus microplus]